MNSKSKVENSVETKPKRICPICNVEASEKFYPFCSKKCEKLDLNRWLSGAYAIPSAEEDLPDDDDVEENRE